MAFSRDGWNPIGGQSKKGTAPQLFSYTTTDAHTVVDGSGYLNAVSDDVAVGDMVMVRGNTGGTATLTMHVVVSNASGVVDLSDGTVIGSVTAGD
mgnify:FL=1|tara:strand:+ start:8718 stop:9002 length:285 start_codon:yes stop_codon:yes gene_type:complete